MLGYFQQGEELKLNTEALKLQIEELKSSVDQQKELVRITEKGIQISKESHELELESKNKSLKSAIEINRTKATYDPSLAEYRVHLSNHGNTARNLKIHCNKDEGDITPKSIASISSSSDQEFLTVRFLGASITITIHYTDGSGKKMSKEFTISRGNTRLEINSHEEIYLTDY